MFPCRLAVVVSHPVQYYSPWFRFLAANFFERFKVFYLWEGGVNSRFDQGFGIPVKWDIPLLEGYTHEFVSNRSKSPGTGSVGGLDNPDLADRLERFNPGAVLVFGYNYRTHYRFLFRRRPATPLLFRGDSHRLFVRRGLKEQLRRRWIALVYRRFAAFLYVGAANRDYFLRHGVPEEKLFFSPHAVDNQRFFGESDRAEGAAAEWKRELGIAASKRVVLFAGKFEEKKRPGDLLDAFKLANLTDATLVLAGSGRLGAELCSKASAHPNIVFAPFQNQSMMPRTYSLADVVVLPSFGGGETWGLSINEAMCMGRPVIVSDHVGCGADLVKPRENGLIFPAGDVAALAGALREALSDDERLKAWGRRGRELIQEYNYERATDGLLAALRFVKGTQNN